MAKHNIQGTSTVCGAAGHTWKVGIAPNYRHCGQCRTVEVLVNGQWVSPTGRTKRVHSDLVAGPALMDVADRNLQANVTPLVSLPTVKLLNSSTVLHPVVTHRVMTRRELGEKLFQWGTDHAYPQLHVRIPERVYAIADAAQSEIRLSERIHTIVSGVAAWRAVCFQCPQPVIEAALEQVKTYQHEWPELREEERVCRLALIECGRERGWARFTFKATTSELRGYHFTFIVDTGEDAWTRFAYSGRYDHVCEAMKLLEQKKEVVQ